LKSGREAFLGEQCTERLFLDPQSLDPEAIQNERGSSETSINIRPHSATNASLQSRTADANCAKFEPTSLQSEHGTELVQAQTRELIQYQANSAWYEAGLADILLQTLAS